MRQKAAQICIICDNLRSVFNVGSLFRTAECLGVGEVLLCGISPTPQHSNMEKTAMGTQSLVAWRHLLRLLRPLQTAGSEATKYVP
jgi:tRNA G18 (ribose-2'-O)-methylase SpoU